MTLRRQTLGGFILALLLGACTTPVQVEPEPSLGPTTVTEALPPVPADDDQVLPPQDPSLGAIEIQAPRDPYVEQQVECPPDETLYVTELEPNTFEVGIRWELPGELRQTPKAYTRYRCIPR